MVLQLDNSHQLDKNEKHKIFGEVERDSAATDAGLASALPYLVELSEWKQIPIDKRK